MSSSNPVKKVTNPLEDYASRGGDNASNLISGVQRDPINAVGVAGVQGVGGAVAGAGRAAVQGMRNNAIAEGEKQAQKAIQQAADAEAAAANAGPKTIDELALQRRQRAAIQAKSGRSGTDLTGGTSLGSVDVVRKMLLGM